MPLREDKRLVDIIRDINDALESDEVRSNTNPLVILVLSQLLGGSSPGAPQQVDEAAAVECCPAEAQS